MITKQNVQEAVKGEKTLLYCLLSLARRTEKKDIEKRYLFNNGCPDYDLLNKYSLKLLDVSDIKKVTYHVAYCPGCLGILLDEYRELQDLCEEEFTN